MYEASPQLTRRRGWKTKLILAVAALLAVLTVGLMFFSCSMPTSINANANRPPLSSPTGANLPEFPWPPRASAFMNIPSQYVANRGGATLLKDVGLRLESVLRQAGYGQFGYYSIPRGFALTTRLEQFKSDGLPADEPYRFTQQIPNPRLFTIDYVRTLLQGKTGHYRVIVFVVTDDEFFAQNEGRSVEVAEAEKLAIEGANKLPDSLGNTPFTDRYWCAALIYEFEKASLDQPTEFKHNSSLLPQKHLQKILPYLENQP